MKKICWMCRKSLGVNLFYKDKTQSDGLNARCKSCERDRQRDWKAHDRKKKENNPKFHKAKSLVSSLVKAGRLLKTPCYYCGSKKNLEGHHLFYDEPEKVLWLCRMHHHKFHKLWKLNSTSEKAIRPPSSTKSSTPSSPSPN